jgi:hypothetical protein
MLVAVCAAIVTLPALIEVNVGTDAEPLIVPVAFYAVTSVAVQGLYLSFAIPIFLRWKHGEKFEVGEWNNGAVPFSSDFEWKFVNYAPIVTLGVLLGITIWWQTSAKKWFKGPIRTIDESDVAPEFR